MNAEAIARARNCLNIADVYLRDAAIVPADSFDARQHPPSRVNFQWGAHEAAVIEITTDGETPQVGHIWRVKFLTHAKLLWPHVEAMEPGFNPGVEDIACLIRATFIAEYHMRGELDDVALQEFATHNVSYHVWPYWREFLSDASARLRIPPIMLPMHVISSPNPSDVAPKPEAAPAQG